jgi:cobalamin biosynthetic protein CobC
MTGVFHGGGLAAAIDRYGGRPDDWLDLSTGINPEMAELPALPDRVWNRLPDRELDLAARKAAWAWYAGKSRLSAQSPTLPLAVPGTQALIQVLPKLVPQGRPVAILAPTYGEYAHCFHRAGFAVEEITGLDGLRDEHGTVVVVNPNNPTGRCFDRQTLAALAARLASQGAHLHVDEAFGDMSGGLSMAGEAATLSAITVSRSFGKFFGLAGLRLGFVFAQSALIDAIAAELGPWPVSGPALAIAADLLSRDHAAFAGRIAARARALDAVLSGAGLEILGGTDLFRLVRVGDAGRLYEHLARSHILVRRFDYAGDWLRIGLTPDEQGDRRLADALAAARD